MMKASVSYCGVAQLRSNEMDYLREFLSALLYMLSCFLADSWRMAWGCAVVDSWEIFFYPCVIDLSLIMKIFLFFIFPADWSMFTWRGDLWFIGRAVNNERKFFLRDRRKVYSLFGLSTGGKTSGEWAEMIDIFLYVPMKLSSKSVQWRGVNEGRWVSVKVWKDFSRKIMEPDWHLLGETVNALLDGSR